MSNYMKQRQKIYQEQAENFIILDMNIAETSTHIRDEIEKKKLIKTVFLIKKF